MSSSTPTCRLPLIILIYAIDLANALPQTTRPATATQQGSVVSKGMKFAQNNILWICCAVGAVGLFVWWLLRQRRAKRALEAAKRRAAESQKPSEEDIAEQEQGMVRQTFLKALFGIPVGRR